MRALLLGTLALALVSAAGCRNAPAPPRRGAIRGTVTLDGNPLPHGKVRFIALEAGGVNALAEVKDGVYELTESNGPVKGKYRVEFSVPKPGPRVRNPDVRDAWLENEPVETLPARYHRDSTYLLDYDPDDPKPYDAQLTSQ
jgi:hypothetical protein